MAKIKGVWWPHSIDLDCGHMTTISDEDFPKTDKEQSDDPWGPPHEALNNANGTEKECPACLEIKKAETDLSESLENPGGDYYTGLRCGIEDRDITDRYEAVEYGWDQAFSYIESILEATK